MVLKGITGAAVARELGVTRGAVNAVIGGHWRSPRVEAAIARALKVRVSDLWPEKTERKVA